MSIDHYLRPLTVINDDLRNCLLDASGPMQEAAMRGFTRRLFLTAAALPVALACRPASADSATALPEAMRLGGMPLLEALSLRRSIRLFDDKSIEEGDLSTLLWCAFGLNRPATGGHTAPSWHGSMETAIYVADGQGVRQFDPMIQAAPIVLAEDIRMRTGAEPFVGTAPVVLIYVADRARMYEASAEEQIQAAHVDTAIVAQNVYLYCASVGLGTCLVSSVDKRGLAQLLKLPKSQIVTFVQPVGYPKPAV